MRSFGTSRSLETIEAPTTRVGLRLREKVRLRLHRRKVAAVAAVAAVALSAGATALVTPAASAASQGAGFGTWAPISAYGWHGSMLIDGRHTYCVSPGADAPVGTSTDNGVTGEVAGLDPQQLTAINLLVTKYGQTWDPEQAAAVAWAVKAVADFDTTIHEFGYPGSSLAGAINWTFSSLAPQSNAEIQGLATAYYAEALATPAGITSGHGTLSFDIDPGDDDAGTATADAPAGTTGTIQLTNAVFADNGTNTLAGAKAGVAYAVRGAPADDAARCRISGSGRFGDGYAAAVHLFTTPGQQSTAGPGGLAEFTVAGEDERARSAAFAPQIATQVVQRYVPGGRFVDDVTFSASGDAWRRFGDGGFAVVSATATVYRTSYEPVEQAGVPADAEEVGTLALTTDAAIGPSQPYRVESAWEIPGPGFYTAVWTISGASQSAATQAVLRSGEDYAWVEAFGEQSQISMVADITSRAQAAAAKGGPAKDTIIVAGVLPAAGAEISTAFYRVPEGTDAAEACVRSNLVWQSQPLHVDAVGEYGFEAPRVPGFGLYAWQHTAVDTDGEHIAVSECGEESELTTASVPTISSQAPATAGFAGLVEDLAVVEGTVPADGETFVTFDLYRALDGAAPEDSCTAETFVGATDTSPVTVTGAGVYTSPGVRTRDDGIHYSIEHLWWRADASSVPELLAQGRCGLENETTVVDTPALTTVATPKAGVGGAYSDVATVTGLADDVDAQIVFEVFHNTAGQSPTCTADTLVATKAVDITGSGEFASPELIADRQGAQLWVATLTYVPEGATTRVVLAEGECGEANEVTQVSALAETGVDASVAPWIAGGAAALVLTGIGAVVAGAIRRRSAA